MASLIILKGSGGATLDLTRYIPMSKYAVNNICNYDEWIDTNLNAMLLSFSFLQIFAVASFALKRSCVISMPECPPFKPLISDFRTSLLSELVV